MSMSWAASLTARLTAGLLLLAIGSGGTYVFTTSNRLVVLEERQRVYVEAAKRRDESISRLSDTVNSMTGKVVLNEQRGENLAKRQEQVERLLRYWRRQGYEVPI